jgi:hypothetical protein
MWLFTSKSFLSVVADKDQPDGPKLLVRSRVEGDIEEIFPTADVKETPNGDYRFRAWIPREIVAQAVSRYVDQLSYPNFKNSVTDKQRLHPLMKVWQTMYNHQEDRLHSAG